MLQRVLGLVGIALILAAVIGARAEFALLVNGQRAHGTIVAKTLDDAPARAPLWPGLPIAPAQQGFIMVRFVDQQGEHMVAERIGYFASLFEVGQTATVVYHATYPEGARVSRYLLLVWPALGLAGAGLVVLAAACALGVYRMLKRRIAHRLAGPANPDIRADVSQPFDPKKLFERRDDRSPPR